MLFLQSLWNASNFKTPISYGSFQNNHNVSLFVQVNLKNLVMKQVFIMEENEERWSLTLIASQLALISILDIEDYPNQDHFEKNWGVFDH